VAALYDQRRRVRALEEQLLRDLEFHGIAGKSPVMLEVFDFAPNVARHDTNVLLVRPAGTGKELVARAIHQLSPVSQQRLTVCNCSAMVDTLLESSCLGTCWEHSRVRRKCGWDYLSIPTAERFFWTKWAKRRWRWQS
jgi:transcriptional regulator with GAF, ATPase, and Fis domain